MTKKLSELFDLPEAEEPDHVNAQLIESAEVQEVTQEAYNNLEKIENALPQVRGLEAADTEMDDLAKLAQDSYKDLMDLGMQVDSRFASEIFSVASNMLGHAITAKTAKLDKKLKMIDLQMKKMRLDQQAAAAAAKEGGEDEVIPTAQGMVLSRNDLLERIISGNKENTKKE